MDLIRTGDPGGNFALCGSLPAVMPDYRSLADDWRNSAISLIDTEKGEGKAQAGVIA